MRPKKAEKFISKAIVRWLHGNPQSLRDCLPILKREYKRKGELDLRTGEETYGYYSQESIRNHMSYISDRWRAKFRIRWLIDGIEAGHI